MKSFVLNVNKTIGMTPYQAIHRVRERYPAYQQATLGYAGRLDPMAEGVLLILIDEENKKRKSYELLPKIYDFEVVLGIETDTYDLLGMVQRISTLSSSLPDVQTNVIQYFRTLVGKWEQSYPPYSAARANGKPLFYWAREDRLDEVKIPQKQIEIYDLRLNDISTIPFLSLQSDIFSRIESVSGSFRQKQIQDRWREVFRLYPHLRVTRLSCRVHCSSGTYVRSLAHMLGKQLSSGGVAYSIRRIAVGPFSLDNALALTSTKR